MKIKPVVATLIFFIWAKAHAQINMEDSTVQVITYWEKGNKKEYLVTKERTTVLGKDTTKKEISTYEILLNVKGITNDSYSIELTYKNFNTTATPALYESLTNLTLNNKIIYKTDENGTVEEITNWKDIQQYLQKNLLAIKKDSKQNPKIVPIIEQMEASIKTKENIEAICAKDINQLHAFHGLVYKQHEVLSENIELPNLFGSKPFDAVITIVLKEINDQEKYYELEMNQVANKEQVINAAYEYFAKIAKDINAPAIKREDFNHLKNEIQTKSRIHDSGWVINSTLTSTTHSGKFIIVEKKTIESK